MVALRVYRRTEGEPALLAERALDAPRITIGRSAECTLVLEDPKKWVSRMHADLSTEAGALWLTVLSRVNPVFVNGERQAPGSRRSVQAGDRLKIGDYEIELLPSAAPEPPAPPPAVEATFLGEPVPEIDFVLEAESAVRPSLAAGETAVPSSAPATEATHERQPASQPAVEPEPALQLSVEPEPAPPPTQAPAPGAVGDHIFAEATALGAAAPESLFEEPTLVGKATPAAVPSVEDSVLLEVTQLRANLPPPESGLFETEAQAGEETGPGTATAEEISAGPSGSAEPTLIGAPISGASEAAIGRAARADATLSPVDGKVGAEEALERALKAFLEGAGVGGRVLAGAAEREQLLRQSGALVRAAVEGVMALLAARAEAKKEFRAEDRTMVASRDNNPLKLMADPQEAMDFLLDTKEHSGGFLPPLQAMADAFDDVRAHEAALIAGMRAAVLGAIRRFDPAALEEGFLKASGGFGLNRKAKLWDLFCAFQQKLAREAEEDFNKAFGRDFIAAYTAQVARLRRK